MFKIFEQANIKNTTTTTTSTASPKTFVELREKNLTINANPIEWEAMCMVKVVAFFVQFRIHMIKQRTQYSWKIYLHCVCVCVCVCCRQANETDYTFSLRVSMCQKRNLSSLTNIDKYAMSYIIASRCSFTGSETKKRRQEELLLICSKWSLCGKNFY